MPLRHFRNEAFSLDLVLPYGEYFAAIPLENGAMIPFPRKKAGPLPKGYLNTNGVWRKTPRNTMKLPINN